MSIEQPSDSRPAPRLTTVLGWRAAAIVFGLVILACALDLVHRFVGEYLDARRIAVNRYTSTTIFWLTYLPLLPVPLLVARHWEMSRTQPARGLLAHLVGSVFFSYVHMFASASVRAIWTARSFDAALSPEVYPDALWNIVNNFPIPFLSYWALVLSLHALALQTELHRREFRSSRLESQLVEARLRTLQSQLSPHLFFNTLNAMSALAITGNANATVEMMARLADFLRLCLDAGTPRMVPLSRELDISRQYLDIQRLSFGDRLVVHTVLDPKVSTALVPTLLLQPLLENAIVHGLSQQVDVGVLAISATPHDRGVRITIADNGSGGPASSEGTGLALTRTRLRYVYGNDGRLRYESSVGHGTRVTIDLPFMTFDDAPCPTTAQS
jgi:two-component system, LytTR family, sensor kinase